LFPNGKTKHNTQRHGTVVDDAVDDEASSLLELLLGAELVGVTALLLAAVGGTGRETGL
jgi:hypothetical protein